MTGEVHRDSVAVALTVYIVRQRGYDFVHSASVAVDCASSVAKHNCDRIHSDSVAVWLCTA